MVLGVWISMSTIDILDLMRYFASDAISQPLGTAEEFTDGCEGRTA
jgi:hypothetical protein